MVILKKIKSATLVETLIATVLIVVIFIIASLTINNILLNDFNRNTLSVENRLYELEYSLEHNKIELPYTEKYEDWDIIIERNNQYQLTKIIEFKAENNKRANVVILKKRIHE